MFYVLIALILLYVGCGVWHAVRVRHYYENRIVNLKDEEGDLKRRMVEVDLRLQHLEDSISRTFLLYELTRKISPVFKKESALRIFKDELFSFGEAVDDVTFYHHPKSNYSNYKLNTEPGLFVSVKTSSPQVEKNLRTVVKTLNVCLEKIHLYEQMETLSIHDSLTGVYNRRYFNMRLEEEAERAKKFSLKFSLLMIDIDHFKKVNDTYGHLVGDAVLREVAQKLQSCLREIDFVARYGGEEFVVILQETDKDGALFVAERIRSAIGAKKIRAFDEQLLITVSIGMVVFPRHTTYPELLIEVADKALYKAKKSGRNRTECF